MVACGKPLGNLARGKPGLQDSDGFPLVIHFYALPKPVQYGKIA